jgi:hypothetical protein
MTVLKISSQTLCRCFAICVLCLWAQACGRYGNPFPPEALAPQAVGNLSAKASETSIILAWTAPRNDLRGRELSTLDGYKIYRQQLSAEVTAEAVPTRKRLEPELLAIIPDTHIAVRDELRVRAREEGKLARRVRVDPELVNFEYSDQDVLVGSLYKYTIVPFNQGRVEGLTREAVEVLFRGRQSRILIGAKEIEADNPIMEDFSLGEDFSIPNASI